ncbi:MFS transporter [Rhodosalinus halophilus]|uniref:MFS transporter n=1 Tax=Rhodosalinus halophilus TaxID=2259333 RepID=A0A365U4P8_9RHOB|nr:MFS transporter [Rhodosalinus halophilus]RBI83220.1 MFS transporter [Rhodosalinus halophilus]
MLTVLNSAWALLLGLFLLMIGNGLQGTLLGVRGEIEGFSAFEMSVVMAAYFVGFLGGSRMAPRMIARVGHVRVFSALASMVSAVVILFPVFTDPWLWAIGRLVIGFCFSGVYVTAESWLNNTATNETRGQTLSVYVLVQVVGLIAGQALLVVADPSGFVLFVIPAVLVSISFAPILLSVSPAPAFGTAKPMTLAALYKVSPLGLVGMLLLGTVFSAQFGMSAVYGAEAGLSVQEISIFVSAFFVGALVLQYPLGWLSDRMDRRVLILGTAAVGTAGAVLGLMLGAARTELLLAAALLIGGVSNPLYSLLIAYTNDFLEPDDMAAASSGLVFVNGVGAIVGPLAAGWVMQVIGPPGFFATIAAFFALLVGYAAWRMTQRPAPAAEETGTYAPLGPTVTPVAVEFAQEYAIDTALEEQENPDDAR